MEKLKYILFILLIIPEYLYGQNTQEHKIDSLKLIIEEAKEDTTIINALKAWDNLIYLSDPILDLELNRKIDSLSSINLTKELSDYESTFFLESKVFALNSFGIDARNRGNQVKAIEYFSECRKIQERIDDQLGLANSLHNIGIIYSDQNEIEKAITYFEKALKIQEEIKDKTGSAMSLHHLGGAYQEKGELETALDFNFKSLTISEESGNNRGCAMSLNNIGVIFQDKGDYDKALEYYSKSLDKFKLADDQMGVSYGLLNLGNIYFEQKNFSKAIKYGNQSLTIAREMDLTYLIMEISELLWSSYKEIGSFKKSLEMHELFSASKDSVFNEENQKAVIQQQYKYEYEKKAAADSIKAMEEAKIKDALLTAEKAETEKQKAQVKQQEQQKYFLFGGLTLALLFGGFIFNRFRVTSKQKDIIEDQKTLVEKQKQIVEESHKKLELTHLQLEESHKEITDSINYAERIQRSFLATKETLETNLKNYFVFFKPKEAVSGDFYWAAELKDGNFAWSIADSTGHGVPGAIMSLLNISSLEKAIETETSPEKILFKTREIIINRLKKDGSPDGGKDGMDCSLLVINKERTTLTFASANNPVVIIRENEIIEFKGDKIPVGKHDRDSEPFALRTLELKKGDVIYALTDGYPDQFGGKKGKKYMIKNLKNKLLEISNLPMAKQRSILEKEFIDWKNNTEQIDDVCIMGVKI